MDLSWWSVAKGPRPKTYSEKTDLLTDHAVRVSIHKTLNSSRRVIRCRDLADMTEVEIRNELKDQGVVGVNRVTVKTLNTLFLDVRFPGTPERDHG